MTELRFALQPKQKQFLQAIADYPVTMYGGAKGGGKSHGLRTIMLLRRFQYPKSIGKLFRRTYAELEDNHIQPLFRQYPSLIKYYNVSHKTLNLPNGSVLQFCHCNNEKDVFLYQGRETHDLAIDQAEQWTEAMFSILRGSNRSSIEGIHAKTILTANPGDIGHAWLRRLFIDRRFNERERPADYTFIQALVDDNPALMLNDPDYVRRLESEPNEALRKAYRYGDWNIFAGQFFQEISKEVHFIKPFDIPPHWERFGAYDYGFNHPAAFGWFANDEDGNTYLYRELIKAGVRVDQFAAEVNSYDDTALLSPIVAGRDCWTQKSTLRDDAQPPTVAEQFATHEIMMKPAVVDRIQGAAQLRAYLAWRGTLSGKPRFFIFDTCPISFDTISRMIHDPKRVEDVLKIDATDSDPLSGDDAYDMVRYGLMSRPMVTDPIVPRIAVGSPQWYQEQSQNIWEREREKMEQDKQEWGDMGGWSNL